MILRTDSVTGNNRMMKACDLPVELKGTAWVRGLALLALIFVASLRLDAAAQQQFASPDEAVNALVAAAKARDTNTLHAIFGPAAHELVSPDIVQATQRIGDFPALSYGEGRARSCGPTPTPCFNLAPMVGRFPFRW